MGRLGSEVRVSPSFQIFAVRLLVTSSVSSCFRETPVNESAHKQESLTKIVTRRNIFKLPSPDDTVLKHTAVDIPANE